MAYSHERLVEELKKAGNDEIHLANIRGAWLYHVLRENPQAPEVDKKLETGVKSVDDLIEAFNHDTSSMIGFHRVMNAIARGQGKGPKKGKPIKSAELITSLLSTKKLLKRLKARGVLD